MGVISAIVSLCLLRVIFAVDWCSDNLMCTFPNGTNVVKTKNIMCEGKERESINQCYNMVKRQESSVRTLLAMHNTFRDRMAKGTVLKGWPTASDMRQMVWDDELAEQALRWAFQCVDAEDPCRTHPVYTDEGQNYGAVTHRNPDLVHVFRKWIREGLNAAPTIVSSMVRGEHENFALIILSTARKMGCGVVDYSLQSTSGPKALRVVCNYDDDFMGGAPLYKQGETCSACPAETSCRPNSTYKNLCALESDPSNERPIVVLMEDDEPEDENITTTMFFSTSLPLSSTANATVPRTTENETEVPSPSADTPPMLTSSTSPEHEERATPQPLGGQEPLRGDLFRLTLTIMILLICNFLCFQ